MSQSWVLSRMCLAGKQPSMPARSWASAGLWARRASQVDTGPGRAVPGGEGWPELQGALDPWTPDRPAPDRACCQQRAWLPGLRTPGQERKDDPERTPQRERRTELCGRKLISERVPICLGMDIALAELISCQDFCPLLFQAF